MGCVAGRTRSIKTVRPGLLAGGELVDQGSKVVEWLSDANRLLRDQAPCRLVPAAGSKGQGGVSMG